MRKLNLNAHYHIELPFKVIKQPRERFVRYYNDLYALEGIQQPELNSYIQTTQYSYSELGDALFAVCPFEQIIADVDLVVIAYWSHEFDPDGSFGAYFANKYGITTRFFDVCDQGILSPICAIKIIQAFIDSGKANKAALVCFDQMAIPVEKGFIGAFPSKNSAHLIIFEAMYKPDTIYQVVEAKLLRSINVNKTSSTVIISPQTPYYSCSELFIPILHPNCKNNLAAKIDLMVIDSESDQVGILSLTAANG